MGYAKIPNLYKDQDILMFRECYAMEKIHGTSAHIRWEGAEVKFHSGGEKHESFVALFDADALKAQFEEMGHTSVTIYGEAYGGKCQGMSKTYGPDLRFVAFEVHIGDSWLDVPTADRVATRMGLEFVAYERTSTELSCLDWQRRHYSVQARRNGIVEDKMREGIVLRPLKELARNDGSRIIAKYKNEAFAETATKREVTPEKLAVLGDAENVAEEWVTDMRMAHILDQFRTENDDEPSIEHTGAIIKLMQADVQKEADGEVVFSNPVFKAIGKKTAQMFKARLQAAIGG